MLTVSIPKLLHEAHAIKEALEQMGEGVPAGISASEMSDRIAALEAIISELDKANAQRTQFITSLSILCRLFGKDMASSKSGVILNIASVAAFQAGPLMSTYYASKAYVLLFSEDLKNELKEDGVKVAVLCPGPTKTKFFQRNSWTCSKVETSHYLMSAAARCWIWLSRIIARKNCSDT